MTVRPSRRAVLVASASLIVVRPERAFAAPAPDAEALNEVLATEHAAIYDLAAVGATLGVAARAQVLLHYDEHRQRRDALGVRIRALGGTPVAALPAYADPVPGPDGAVDLVAVEQAVVQAYHGVIGSLTDPGARALCAQAFVAESRQLALARRTAGVPAAPEAFVTGA